MTRATLWAMLLIIGFGSASAAMSKRDGARGVVDQVKVLPRPFVFKGVREDFRIHREHVEGVKAAAALHEDDARVLLRSSSPIDRGVGLWSLYAQGNHQALFEASQLLDDDSLTLPWEGRPAGFMQYRYSDQTVGEYLRFMYGRTLGFEAGDRSAAEFKEMYAAITDTDTLVGPWVFQLRRSIYDLAHSVELKAAVRNLPATTRWLVLTESMYLPPHPYTPEEASAELALLSAEAKRNIMDGTIEPPVDPLYRKRVDGRAVNEWRDGAPPKWLLETARSSLTGAPPAAPAPEEMPAAEPPVEAPPG